MILVATNYGIKYAMVCKLLWYNSSIVACDVYSIFEFVLFSTVISLVGDFYCRAVNVFKIKQN